MSRSRGGGHERGRLSRVSRSLSAGALAAVAAALPLAVAGAEPEQKGPQLANAVAEGSLVYVQTDWSGYVIVPAGLELPNIDGMGVTTGGTYGPWQVTTTCSGFVASSTGDIVTAGHCVDADSFDGGKGAILDAEVSTWVNSEGGPLTPAQQAELTSILRANADVEGLDGGSPPDRAVTVTVPSLSTKAQPASVVDLQPFADGDVALLRATGVVAPVLPVAGAAAENGDSIVASGYPGAVAAVVDATASGSYKAGTVSGTQTVNGTPFTEITADTSPGMSGGPVVDMSGEVVGTVSWAPTADPASANFITDVGSIRSILAGNGVENAVGEADQAYRQGLTYYFDSRYHDAVAQLDKALALEPGWKTATEFRQKAVANYPNDVNPPGPPVWAIVAGAAVLLLAVVAGVFLLRRRKAAPPATEPVTAPTGGGPAVPPAAAEPVTAEPEAQRPPEAVPHPGEPAPQPAPEHQHVFCPNCGARHDAAAHYCEECGQPFAAAMPSEHDRS